MSILHPLPLQSAPTLSVILGTFPGTKTLLFDMDGTLFDTEKYHTLALQTIGTQYNVVAPFGPKEVHAMMMGRADHLVFEIVKDWPGFPRDWDAEKFVSEKNRHFLDLLKSVRGETYFNPVIQGCITEARKAGLNVGLVTSSEKVVTHALLDLTHIREQFHYVLTRDDSKRVKPDPWPYLRAMEEFKSAPHETLIFEDSNVGLEAARLSGAHVVKAEWY